LFPAPKYPYIYFNLLMEKEREKEAYCLNYKVTVHTIHQLIKPKPPSTNGKRYLIECLHIPSVDSMQAEYRLRWAEAEFSCAPFF
jgi:hypothetical protein